MDNIDQLKSSSPSDEDQIDMMMMMMMMQLPEFSAPYGNSTTVEGFPPPPEFHVVANSGMITRTSTITMPLSDSIDNPATMHWSSFTDHQLPSNNSNTTSFSNNSTTTQLLLQQQEQATSENNKRNSMAAMREMIFRMAAMQPINIDPESVKPPKRRNVKISKDPQSVAARHRRERISERIRILQRLVPGGTKMDTASMLDEAIHYVKFLKSQVRSLEQRAAANNNNNNNNNTIIAATATAGAGARGMIGFPVAISSRSVPAASASASTNYLSLPKPYQPRNLEHYGDA